MRATTIVKIIILILTSCGQKPSNNLTMVFPTVRYTNWTNFEQVHLAFKLNNDGISIDNNYDFESKNFKQNGFEKSSDYPATTDFLQKTFIEYQTLAKEIDTSSCARLTPIYIEYKNGRVTDLISFKTVAECIVDKDSIPDIVNELWTLRQKYTRLQHL